MHIDFQYGIIGDGRVARHFSYYLFLLDIPFQQWSRAKSQVELEALLTVCDPILVLIKDQAIECFIQEQPGLKQKNLVHFSGSLHSQYAYGAHPLMTFSHDLYSLDIYQKIPFILTTQTPPFEILLPGLKNPHFKIPDELKAYYHALCVMSGNFTTLLWQKFFKELEQNFKIPASAASLFLQQTMKNIEQNPELALTGPLARQDQDTIHANLQALMQDPFLEIYQAFVHTYENTRLSKI